MVIYLYILITNAVSFVVVGLYYATYSIFLRSQLSNEKGTDMTATANALENAYLVFILLIILLSTSVHIQYAEVAFRVASLFMGAFSVLSVVCSILFALDGITSASVFVLMMVYFLVILMPLLCNWNYIKPCTFLTGTLACIYFAPTYINIIPIYAISNLHDVTWGSRPTVSDKSLQSQFAQREKNQETMYKNYRSNFLVRWCICNIVVAKVTVDASRNNHTWIIMTMAGFLALLIFFKLFCAIIYNLCQ